MEHSGTGTIRPPRVFFFSMFRCRVGKWRGLVERRGCSGWWQPPPRSPPIAVGAPWATIRCLAVVGVGPRGDAAITKKPRPTPGQQRQVAREVAKHLVVWKQKPTSPLIQDILPHIKDFIKGAWLDHYPEGANLRKLQRDVAFRMSSGHRPGKLPKEVLMPVLGQLEEEGAVQVRIRRSGRCLIYRPGTLPEYSNETGGGDAVGDKEWTTQSKAPGGN